LVKARKPAKVAKSKPAKVKVKAKKVERDHNKLPTTIADIVESLRPTQIRILHELSKIKGQGSHSAEQVYTRSDFHPVRMVRYVGSYKGEDSWRAWFNLSKSSGGGFPPLLLVKAIKEVYMEVNGKEERRFQITSTGKKILEYANGSNGYDWKAKANARKDGK
jgi:hypothetical protein